MDREPDVGRLAGKLAEGTRQAVSAKDVNAALAVVVNLTVEIGLGDEAGITERHGKGRFETAAPTDPMVLAADHRQYELGEGPCVQASYEGGILISQDVAADPRWPVWGPAAKSLGIHQVLSVHLYTAKDAIGAMNIYSLAERTYTHQDLDLARLLGAHASTILGHFREGQHLWKTVDARHQIGVAQGILSHEYRIPPERALALLHRVSSTRNVKMNVLAAEIITNLSGAGIID